MATSVVFMVAAIIAAAVAVAAVVVVGVVAVVATGGLAGWIKIEQTASLASPGPWPCLASAFDGNGSSAGPGPLLQRNKKQRKKVRIRHLYTHSLTQDEGFCETPPQLDAPTSATCLKVLKP